MELGAPAQTGGVAVGLASLSPDIKSPASITVPAGNKFGYGIVTTGFVSQRITGIVKATYNGDSPTASLEVVPNGLVTFDISPSVMKGGLTADGTVVIATPAPRGGRKVAVVSDNLSVIVPQTIIIPEGKTAVGFKIQSKVVIDDTVVAVSVAIDGTTLTKKLTLTPSSPLSSIIVSPNPVDSGTYVTIKVLKKQTIKVLDKVTISGSFGTKEQLNVSGNTTEVVFENVLIEGQPGPARVYAECLGSTIQGTYTVNAIVMKDFVISAPSLFERRSALATVTLNSPAPTGGVTVSLSSSSPALPVPATVTVPEGQKSVSFGINATSVTQNVTVVISATGPGSSRRVITQVNDIISKVGLTPNPVILGTEAEVVITKAVTPFDLGRIEAKLADGTVVAQDGIAGNVVTASVGKAKVLGTLGSNIVRLTFEGEILSGNYTIVENKVTAITVTQNPIDETQSTTGIVSLMYQSPEGGTTVHLESSNSEPHLPSSVVIPQGASSATFSIESTAVKATTVCYVKATLGALSVTKQVIIRNITVDTALAVAFLPLRTAYARGTSLTVKVTLRDAKRNPLANRTIVVRRYINTNQSPEVIGTVVTDSAGVGILPYTVPTNTLHDNVYIEGSYDGNPDALRNGPSVGSRRIPIGK